MDLQVLAERAVLLCNGLQNMEPLLTIALRRIGAVLMKSSLRTQFDVSEGGPLREMQNPTSYTVRLHAAVLVGCACSLTFRS